jgi:flagellar biosynthesis/type III secretory pathway M-ring protein FliF/YscJ
VAGVFPLVLLFANVKLTPSAPTDLVGQSQLRDQNGKLLPASPEPKFTAVTTSALAAAISWTLLAIVLVLIALIFLISRYVRNTRERMFDAIDAATAEAQRAAQARSATPAKETVSAGAPEPRS